MSWGLLSSLDARLLAVLMRNSSTGYLKRDWYLDVGWIIIDLIITLSLSSEWIPRKQCHWRRPLLFPRQFHLRWEEIEIFNSYLVIYIHHAGVSVESSHGHKAHSCFEWDQLNLIASVNMWLLWRLARGWKLIWFRDVTARRLAWIDQSQPSLVIVLSPPFAIGAA